MKQFQNSHPTDECDINVLIDEDYRIISIKYSGEEEEIALSEEELSILYLDIKKYFDL